jgi:hypothetical protein
MRAGAALKVKEKDSAGNDLQVNMAATDRFVVQRKIRIRTTAQDEERLRKNASSYFTGATIFNVKVQGVAHLTHFFAQIRCQITHEGAPGDSSRNSWAHHPRAENNSSTKQFSCRSVKFL